MGIWNSLSFLYLKNQTIWNIQKFKFKLYARCTRVLLKNIYIYLYYINITSFTLSYAIFMHCVIEKNISTFRSLYSIIWLIVLPQHRNDLTYTMLANHSWKLMWKFTVTEIQISLNKMPRPFPGEDYTKKGKKIEFKNLSPNHWDNFNQTCHKISLGDARSHIFFKKS